MCFFCNADGFQLAGVVVVEGELRPMAVLKPAESCRQGQLIRVMSQTLELICSGLSACHGLGRVPMGFYWGSTGLQRDYRVLLG